MDQIYLTTDLIELKEYATFDQQSDMDDTIYDYIERLRADEVPESVIEVLLFFGRSSLRVLGVSFAKYDTIASSIGKSKSTVIRAVRVLKERGIIDVIPTTRKWGTYGHSRKKSVNVVRVLPAVHASVTSHNETAGATDEATPGNESNGNTQSEPIVYNHQDLYILDTGFKNCIPTPIFEALSPFYRGADIQRLTGVILRAKANIHRDIRLESHTDAFKTCVLDCIRRLKAGTIKRLDGYLYVSLRKLFRRLSIEESFSWG
jgi:Helix-turn-helix domain